LGDDGKDTNVGAAAGQTSHRVRNWHLGMSWADLLLVLNP
jgi:hypothetical protein